MNECTSHFLRVASGRCGGEVEGSHVVRVYEGHGVEYPIRGDYRGEIIAWLMALVYNLMLT